MATLLPPQPAPAQAPVRPSKTQRAAPSLVRSLIQAVLLYPSLARKMVVPKPVDAGGEGAALAALIEFCEQAGDLCSTQSVMQHFAGSAHEEVLLTSLTSGEQDELSVELLETQLVEGIKRYWMNVRKRGGPAEALLGPVLDLSPEETERARQRALVRQPNGP